MAPKFLSFLSNKIQLVAAITASSGSGDADKIVATDVNGLIDSSLIPPSGTGISEELALAYAVVL